MPSGAIYVGRPTFFGNPFRGPGAVSLYKKWIELGDVTSHAIMEKYGSAYSQVVLSGENGLMCGNAVLKCITDLRGKDLCCWCEPTSQCHADVLLQLANK